MTGKEKVPLLKDPIKGREKSKLTFGRLMIGPVLIFYTSSFVITRYAIPEYIHQRLDEDYVSSHSNSTFDNYTYNACLSNTSGQGYDRYKHVQQETANWQNYLSIAGVTPSIFSTLIWSSYSDIVGRKVLLVTSIAGIASKQLVFAILVHFRANLVWLLLGEATDGVTGSFVTFIAVFFALVADITEPGTTRTIAICLVELIAGTVFAIVSLGTGYYIKFAGYLVPSITGFGVALFAIFMTIVFLSETLREKKPGGCDSLVTSISIAFKLYFRPASRLIQIKYFLLLISFIFYTIQALSRGNLETLYQLGRPFCWSSTEIGWFASARYAALSLIGMGVVVILKKCLADDTIAVISCVITVGSYIVEGFAKTVLVLFTVPVLGTLSLIPVPMIRSLMSHLTPPEKQGAMFSTLGTFETLCSLLGALTTNLVYSATLSIMNGFVFLVLAVITSISGAILCVFMCVQRYHGDQKRVNYQKIVVNQTEC